MRYRVISTTGDTLEIVVSYKCDNCKHDILSTRYHCSLCPPSFDLCPSCTEMHRQHEMEVKKITKREMFSDDDIMFDPLVIIDDFYSSHPDGSLEELCNMTKAKEHMKKHNYAYAIHTLGVASKNFHLHPLDVIEYRLLLAQALKLVRRFNQAEKQIDKCIKAGMSFTDVHNRMGDAFIEYARGDYAEGHFSAAYKSAVFDGDYAGEASALLGLGEAHFANKKFQKAYYFHNKALEIGVAAENRRIIWKAHYELGQTCLNLEKMKFFQEALKHFHKCYTIASSDEEMSLTEGMIITTTLFISDPSELTESIELLDEKASPEIRFNLLYSIGSTYEHRGDNDKCIEYFRKAHKVAEECDLEVPRARAAMAIAEMSARVENDHDVLVYGTEAVQIHNKHKTKLPQMLLYVLGSTYAKTGSYTEAVAMLSPISAEFGLLGYMCLGEDNAKALEHFEGCKKQINECDPDWEQILALIEVSKLAPNAVKISNELMRSKDEGILAILYDELSHVHLLEGNFELSLKYSDLVLALDRPGQETNFETLYIKALAQANMERYNEALVTIKRAMSMVSDKKNNLKDISYRMSVSNTNKTYD